jgi:hypothetical protein
MSAEQIQTCEGRFGYIKRTLRGAALGGGAGALGSVILLFSLMLLFSIARGDFEKIKLDLLGFARLLGCAGLVGSIPGVCVGAFVSPMVELSSTRRGTDIFTVIAGMLAGVGVTIWLMVELSKPWGFPG